MRAADKRLLAHLNRRAKALAPADTETSDGRVAFIHKDGDKRSFQIKAHCNACNRCLVEARGGCYNGGPYSDPVSGWRPVIDPP